MANEMDQFKNMPKEPQLSDKGNLEESNRINQIAQERASLTIESTKEGTQGLLGRLNPNEKKDIARIKNMEALEMQLDNGEVTEEEYNELIITLNENQENITENEQVNESKEKENQEILNKFKDHPSFPILDRFMNIEVGEGKTIQLLTESDLLQLSNHLDGNKDEVEGLRKGIQNIKFEDDRTQTVLDNYLYTVDNINESIEADLEGMYGLPEEFKGEGRQVLSENIGDDVVQLIIKNYKKFPDGEDGNPNIEKDIFTSCEVTLNKIIENKNFPKNKIYEKAVHDIRNGDLNTRVEALQYVNSLVNTQEGMKGAKSKGAFNNIKKSHSLNKESYIKFKIEQIEVQIQNSKDSTEKEKLKIELNSFKEDNNLDDFEGEVFSGNTEIESIGEKITGEGNDVK